MRQAGWRAAVLVAAMGGGAAAQADPTQVCRAGNPQFPQLCDCAISRAQAAGIEGAVLERLLANRWDGVPMDVATRYGLIFVECTQAAVAGGGFAAPIPDVAAGAADDHGEPVPLAPPALSLGAGAGAQAGAQASGTVADDPLADILTGPATAAAPEAAAGVDGGSTAASSEKAHETAAAADDPLADILDAPAAPAPSSSGQAAVGDPFAGISGSAPSGRTATEDPLAAALDDSATPATQNRQAAGADPFADIREADGADPVGTPPSGDAVDDPFAGIGRGSGAASADPFATVGSEAPASSGGRAPQPAAPRAAGGQAPDDPFAAIGAGPEATPPDDPFASVSGDAPHSVSDPFASISDGASAQGSGPAAGADDPFASVGVAADAPRPAAATPTTDPFGAIGTGASAQASKPAPQSVDPFAAVSEGADPASMPLTDPSARDALTGVPGGYTMTFEAAPGTWGRGVLDFPGGGSLLIGVRNYAGLAAGLDCSMGTTHMIVGPFPEGVPSQVAQLVVLGQGGANGRIYQQGTRVQGFNRSHLAVPVATQGFLDALQRGTSFELQLDSSGTHRFGLRGSSRTIGDSRCRYTPQPDWLYALGWSAVRHDPWQQGDMSYRNRTAPGLLLPFSWGVTPHLALSCDRRLVSDSRVSSYDGQLEGQITLKTESAEDVTFPVAFEVEGYDARSDVLSAGELQAMGAADTMEVTFDVNAEPGSFISTRTTMAGFAAGLPGLACPEAPGTPALGGGRDLSGAARWAMLDVALFGDGPYYAAVFSVENGPYLSVDCDGSLAVQSFTSGEQIGRVDLEAQVDGDPEKTTRIGLYYYRGGPAYQNEETPELAAWLMTGERLRLRNLSAPEEDYIYALGGMREVMAIPGACE